jgi:hypothetical protein
VEGIEARDLLGVGEQIAAAEERHAERSPS